MLIFLFLWKRVSFTIVPINQSNLINIISQIWSLCSYSNWGVTVKDNTMDTGQQQVWMDPRQSLSNRWINCIVLSEWYFSEWYKNVTPTLQYFQLYHSKNKLIFNEMRRPSLSWLYGSWIYIYLCLSTLMLWVRIPLSRGVLDKTLCDKVCQILTTGRWYFGFLH
jgi:hypothetical protein